MRPLAAFFLLLGAADLVAIDVVIGPAALADDDDPGAEGTRGHGHGRAAATETVAVPAPPPMPVERTEPDLPPPRPLSVAAAEPVSVEPPEPEAKPQRAPAPEPAVSATPDPRPAAAADNHPDSLPSRLTVHFDLDSAELGRTARAGLDRVAALLEARGELRVDLAGHADESGSEEYNQDLSERRAQAVVDYLQERGVEATRLAVNAFGELQPADPGRTRARKNRRVELRFAWQNDTGDPR